MTEWTNDIEKYRRGELTSSERHALEKKALNDPFLAEALEGAEAISIADFSDDISALNTKILSQKKKPLFTPLRIAAGVILLIGVSFFTLYFYSFREPNELISQNKERQAEEVVRDSSKDSVADSVLQPELLTLNETSKAGKKSPTKLAPLPQVPALSETASTAQPALSALSEEEVTQRKEEANDLSAGLKDEKKTEDAPTTEAIAPAPEPQSSKRDAVLDRSELRKKSATQTTAKTAFVQGVQTITGKVTSVEDNSPLPGVNVIIRGTATGTITDEAGNYSIEVPDAPGIALAFSFIGYQTKDIPVDTITTVNTQLSIDVAQLSEVVVVGYGTDHTADSESTFKTISLAEPAGGRRAFKKYLESNLKYPQQALENKVEGRVTIQFNVTAEGSLNEFKVIKGIGHGCDEEVIRLIKSGPTWSPSRKEDTAVESRMRVRMRFKLPE